MIHKVLKVLKEELEEALNAPDPENPDPETVAVVIDHIGKEDTDNTAINNKVVITLLNVEEELTLKNRPRYEPVENKEEERYMKRNRAAYLNLYVMVAANRDTYEKSLANVSKVIEALQTNKVLYKEEDNLKFKVQLHPLNFDQLSYAWGLLGGKVIPSALYKISIIKIQKAGLPVDIEVITDIDIQSEKKPIANIN